MDGYCLILYPIERWAREVPSGAHCRLRDVQSSPKEPISSVLRAHSFQCFILGTVFASPVPYNKRRVGRREAMVKRRKSTGKRLNWFLHTLSAVAHCIFDVGIKISLLKASFRYKS